MADLTDEGSTTMTDTTGNIDAATKAARDAAERVRETAEDAGASFGATADEIANDPSPTTRLRAIVATNDDVSDVG